VPVSAEPWYINGVILVSTDLKPNELLETLLGIENLFGRSVRERVGPRTLDLDLLSYGDRVCFQEGSPKLSLPHPQLAKRNFVIVPLAEILPYWRHPISGVAAYELAGNLHRNQKIVKLSPQALEI
jgi:2-amino-4-hydroxy-6-hydroxymethyldihydropteridine diphosphokinase